jgi:beta-fructofuranosidase
MWECPDFFNANGQDVLLVSPQEMQAKEYELHAGDGTIYIFGTYDKDSKVFKENTVRAVDMGLDFYAPQTMLTSDGRRIMIAWMQSWCGNWFDENDGFCGMMTIPRELVIRNGILCQNPVKELGKYYGNQTEWNASLTEEFQKVEELSGREQNLDIVLDSAENYKFEMRIAADERYYTSICYDKSSHLLRFDRSCSGMRRDAAHERCIRILSNEECVKLRMVMDRYSVELFINDGEQALTSVIRTPSQIDGVYLRAKGNVKVSIIKNEIIMR